MRTYRYLLALGAALLVLGARTQWPARPATGSVAVSSAPDVQFLAAPAPVPAMALPSGAPGPGLRLISPEPRRPGPFAAPTLPSGDGPDAVKLLRAWGINVPLMYESEGVGRAAPRESVRAAAAFYDHRPGRFPVGAIGLAIPVEVIHYFPGRPEAEFAALLQVRTAVGGVYLLERAGGRWRALPLLEEDSPGFAKAVQVADVDGDQIPELILLTQGGSGPYLTVHIYANPAARRGVRQLWRTEPLPGGSAGFVDLDGDGLSELVLDRDLPGALEGPRAMPQIRDRYTLKWQDGGYHLLSHRRFASSLFWLSLLLDAAARGDWTTAAEAVEPEVLRAQGPIESWYPDRLRKARLPAIWREEMGPATVIEAPPAGTWLVEYGPTGRVRRLQPFQR